MFCVLCVCVCKCVLYYCHRVVTQFQLTNMPYIIYQSRIKPVSINFIHRYMFRHKLQTNIYIIYICIYIILYICIYIISYKSCIFRNPALRQWRTQEFCSAGEGGGSTNSVEDRENGVLGAVAPLVRGSGGSCNLVQEISFYIVKFS